MSGVQEILVLVVIILLIFFLPRMIPRGQNGRIKRSMAPRFPLKITGHRRLSIVASFFWPASVAAYLKPWQGNWAPFFYFGVGPIVLGWSLVWVFAGFKKKKNIKAR